MRPAILGAVVVAWASALVPPRAPRVPATVRRFEAVDLSGDGGVRKVASAGGSSQGLGEDGAVGVLRFEARTASGQLLDAGEATTYTVGDAAFVAGWDLCVRSLRVGERASFACDATYAYGARGVPPAVRPGEGLVFDVEALEYRGNVRTSASFASDTPLTPRTAGAIKAEYERRRDARAVAERAPPAPPRFEGEKNPLDALKDGVSGFFEKNYFFGFFESATGEEAPWYLRPMLTFPAIFLGVGLSFYALLSTDVILLRGGNSPIPGEGVGFSL